MPIKGWQFRPVYQVMVGSKVIWATESEQRAYDVSDKYSDSTVVLVEPDHNMDNTDGQIHRRPSVEGMSDRELMEEAVRNQRYIMALHREKSDQPKFPTPTGVMGTAVINDGSRAKVRGYFGPYNTLLEDIGFWRIDKGAPTWWNMDRITSFTPDPVLNEENVGELLTTFWDEKYLAGNTWPAIRRIITTWARKYGIDVF